MYKVILTALTLIMAVACGEVSESVQEAGDKTVSKTNTVGELQGTWKNEDNVLQTVRFEGNLMITSQQGSVESEENFVIGRTCPNVSDAVEPTGDGRYLAIPDDGRCYFIGKLNADRLEMSLVGKGDKLWLVRAEDG
ncbi:hypothetical protein [Lewinella sp. IMCC34191]|uniref:hypothetical protein n=1 Tax=Lewinella sp. IMCC34191 TaxID=2259172 RepID=UPI000E225B63|nr:hypothetical protein [Lewinella sp. IMCC34191]